MSSNNKKRLFRKIFTTGCGCGRPKLSDVFHPVPKSKVPSIIPPTTLCHSFSTSWERDVITSGNFGIDGEDCTTSTTTFSLNNAAPNDILLLSPQQQTEEEEDEDDPKNTIELISQQTEEEDEDDPKNTIELISPCPKICKSIALEQDSDNPYEDFRHSMLQMILEKEIYFKNDLQELLSCFLQLNSSVHHDIIIQAFTEIWDEVISKIEP